MEDDRDEVNGTTMIHEVMKLAVRMKQRTNGNEQVESVYSYVMPEILNRL